MLKKPTIEELESPSSYRKIKTLSYNEMAFFIVERITFKNRTFFISFIFFIMLSIINILLWIGLRRTPDHPSVLLGIFSGYIIFPVLLAPVHEGLHWMFLKLSGAKNTHIGMDLRQGIIYLSANRHVIGKRAFSIIAFAPLVIISAALILSIIIISSQWLKWVISSILLIHATMCIGDVILTGFMFSIPHTETYTWDDTERKESYFYARIK